MTIAEKVLCYGGIAVEAFIELPYQPKAGIAHIICDETYRIGGGSANVAEWLGSWGVPTRLTGYAIGQDRQGDRLWGWLNQYPSIDLSYLQRRKDIDTLVSRTIPLSNGSKYLLCIGYANVSLVPPTAELLQDISILEIAFYFRQERGNAASVAIGRLAADRGIKIIAMDMVNPEDELVSVTNIIINSTASICEQYPGVEPFQHCRDLQSLNQGIVILTDGSNLTRAIDQDGSQYSLMPPSVPAVDTTGAGDSFRAGVIYGLVQRWDFPQTLRWATAVSALQVQRSLSQDHPPSTDRIIAEAENIIVTQID